MSFNPPTTCAELLTSCSCSGTVTVHTIVAPIHQSAAQCSWEICLALCHYNVDSTRMQMNNVYHPSVLSAPWAPGTYRGKSPADDAQCTRANELWVQGTRREGKQPHYDAQNYIKAFMIQFYWVRKLSSRHFCYNLLMYSMWLKDADSWLVWNCRHLTCIFQKKKKKKY